MPTVGVQPRLLFPAALWFVLILSPRDNLQNVIRARAGVLCVMSCGNNDRTQNICNPSGSSFVLAAFVFSWQTRNRKEFEDEGEATRLKLAGFPQGRYVRIRFTALPAEFVVNFRCAAPSSDLRDDRCISTSVLARGTNLVTRNVRNP